MTVDYVPVNVCSRHMRLSAEGGVITDIQIIGGCNGNLQGLARLVKGMKITELIEKLEGIDCGGRGTSCPAQLAIAARGLLEQTGEEQTEEEQEA